MHSQVQKWGNSLGIRIPKTIAQKLHLHSGSHVELDLLLDRIDSTNCHHENFTDDSNVGNESW